MIKKLFLFILCLTFVVSYGKTDKILLEAEKAYDSKNYKEAIKNYKKLVDAGYRSYQLYFNLGNSYYRNDELGKSIYYYELARKLEPNDEDVRINLGIASAKTIDKIDSKENFFITAVRTNVLSTFSTSTWAYITIALIFAASVLFFVFIASPSMLVKKAAFFVACFFVLTFLVTYILGYSALSSKNENKFAIILVHEVKVVNEPTASATSKFSLHEGTKVRVVDTNGDWVLIKLENGNEGWIKLADVGII